MNMEQTNRFMREAILKGEPCFIGRFGGTEMNMIYEYLKSYYVEGYDNKADATHRLCELSGFFPEDMGLGQQFTDMMLDCCKDIDLQAAWGRYMADFVYWKYQPNTKLTRLDRIEPWNMCFTKSKEKPWSSALAGKKVLVVHPFVDTIKQQYENNREHIFENIYAPEDILPEFELITLKAVQTLAGEKDDRFATWFDALKWMEDECDKLEYDVAIIGCGAYGYPLAAHVKKMGKIAIHLAGATQLLFGITGKRWETEYTYRKFNSRVINEYWVRPAKKENIANGQKVETGCYW